jgi:hypothetical protein
MVPLVAFMCVLGPVVQRTKFCSRKTYFLIFGLYTIFHKKFYFKTVSGESESVQSLRILSDSDPQHWCCRTESDKIFKNLLLDPKPTKKTADLNPEQEKSELWVL